MKVIACIVPAARAASRFIALLALPLAAAADEWAPNLSTTATWHSNATNADQSEDQLDSLQLNADILASERYALTRADSLRLTAHFAGDWWPRYEKLLRGAAGGRIELRHRFGSDPFAPEIAIEGGTDIVETREAGRRGFGTAVLASVRKRFNHRFRATAWHEVSWYNARLGTYDFGASESAIEVDHDLTKVMRVSFSARIRSGDIVTHATGERPDLEDRAPHRVETDTFDRPMTAYRIDAQSWSARLALVRAIDDSTALQLAYEHRSARRGPLRFPAHLLSVAMIHQF